MDMGNLWMGVAEASLNYIVVSTISSMNQKQTVTDLKTDLRTTKEDMMSEIKNTQNTILAKIETDTTAEVEILKTNLKGN